jgi:hypothetical protein
MKHLLTALIAAPALIFGSIHANAQNGQIAILPFEISSNDPGITEESMSSRVQEATATSFQKNAPGVTVQDTRVTNSILAKNNITVKDLKATIPSEVAAKLGVEYVLFGSLEVTNKGTNTYGSGSTSYKDKNSTEKESNKRDSKSSGYSYSSSSSSTTTEYDQKVHMTIYINTGNTVYSANRTPFGSGMDAYNSTIDYLVKRTPFGNKKK